MLEIWWKRREIAPEGQFLLLSTIFSYLMLDFYVKTRIRFSLRDKRLIEKTEVEITRVDCSSCYGKGGIIYTLPVRRFVCIKPACLFVYTYSMFICNFSVCQLYGACCQSVFILQTHAVGKKRGHTM